MGGLGNKKAYGNKGESHAHEFRNLKALGEVIDQLKLIAPIPPGAIATEATLISVLNAIVAADQDIEILLVRDTGAADVVVQQITDYQTGTPVVSYKDVNGVVYVPVGPLEYLDPAAVLNLILTQITVLSTPVTGLAMGFVRATSAAGSPIAAGKRKIAVANMGGANGVVLGSAIKPGEVLTWGDKSRDTLAAFSYDGTGTELLIITTG